MKNNVCLITGASSGIGKATALGLAKRGATIVLHCRDKTRGMAALVEVRENSGNENVDLLIADLEAQQEVRKLADEFKSKYARLNVLINNAGVYFSKRHITVDGRETTFAVNYLAHFLLTNLLLDTLRGSAPARIINVSGDYHRRGIIDFEDLNGVNHYNGAKANNQAQLARVLFTYELARKLETARVTVNCLHPGAIATSIMLKDPDLPASYRVLYKFMKPFFRSLEKGAETVVYLASSPDVQNITGKYFVNCKPVTSAPETYDEELAHRLWEVSTVLTSLPK